MGKGLTTILSPQDSIGMHMATVWEPWANHMAAIREPSEAIGHM